MADSTLPATILQLPMIYGPGDPLHRFTPLVRRMDDDRPGILMSAPMAAWRFPPGFVGNVAAAIAVAATSAKAAGRTYNSGEQPPYSELEWARRVASVMEWKGEFVILAPEEMPAHLRMPGNFEQHWSVDSTRIRSELGFVESFTLDDAIRRTVEWERANPPARLLAPIDYVAEDAALAAASRRSQ